MFVGTLVHVLLQECLKAKARTREDISSQIERTLQLTSLRLDMLNLNLSEADVKLEIEPFLPHILYFIDRWTAAKFLSSVHVGAGVHQADASYLSFQD